MSSTTAPVPGARAGRREWAGLAVLALPILLLALDNSVLFLALPHLGADLQPSSSQLLWVMDIYGFMIAGFLVTMGALGDRIGRRRLLMIGAVAFGAASVAAAYAPSAGMLIVARALLGVAAATVAPSTLSLLGSIFKDPKERALAIGVWTACFSGGTIIGPVVGGMLLERYWWGSAFLLGVPVMALLLALGPVLLPEVRADDPGRLDLASVALSLAAVLPIIYGLKELAKDGLRWVPVAAIVAGAAMAAVFVRRQRRLASPLLDLRLFANRNFTAALGLLLLVMMVLAGIYLFITQYLQLVAGLSPLRAGLWMVPAAAGEMAMATLAPLIARRVRPAYVVGCGLTLSAVGFLVLTQVGSAPGLAVLVAGAVLVFVGNSPGMVLSTDLVVGSAPPDRRGSAASLLETSGEFGVALGVATIGSLGTAVYRSQLPDAALADLPAAAADTAREGLAGAAAVAGQLPAAAAADLLDAARAAFTSGLTTTAALSATLTAGLAVLALTLLRQVRSGGETGQQPEPTDATPTRS